MSVRPEAQNTLYKIHTPHDVPLRFHRDGYLRLAAKVECVKCGKGFMQIIRCHRYLNEIGMLIPARRPNPNDERIMTSFMLAACRNGVGKARAHMAGCPVADMPQGKFLLGDVTTNTKNGYRGRKP